MLLFELKVSETFFFNRKINKDANLYDFACER